MNCASGGGLRPYACDCQPAITPSLWLPMANRSLPASTCVAYFGRGPATQRGLAESGELQQLRTAQADSPRGFQQVIHSFGDVDIKSWICESENDLGQNWRELLGRLALRTNVLPAV
eukprot:scaffold167735_cov30-Tisochrysis_lutea.AAC.2